MAEPNDTERWARDMQIELLAKAGPERRLQLAYQLSASAWNASRLNIDELYPHWTQDQRDEFFLTTIYGAELAREVIAYRQKVKGPQNQTLLPKSGDAT